MRLSKEQLNSVTYPKSLAQKFWTINGTPVNLENSTVLSSSIFFDELRQEDYRKKNRRNMLT